MANGISDFIASINKYGVAKSNRFLVQITPPSSMASGAGEVGRLLQFSCQGAKIPSTSISKSDFRSYGMSYKIASKKTFDDNVDLVFRMDKDYNILQFFTYWMKLIYNPETGDIGYYNDYIGKVEIQMQDQENNTKLTVELEDAYPLSFNSVDLSWREETDAMTFSVAFAYRNVRYGEKNSAESIVKEISSTTSSSIPQSALGSNLLLNKKTGTLSNLNSISNGATSFIFNRK